MILIIIGIKDLGNSTLNVKAVDYYLLPLYILNMSAT